NEATARLSYGVFGGPMKVMEVKLTAAGAGTSGIIPRFWAQRKVADLVLNPEENSDRLLEVAKEFNLVTAKTSLLVLETADQYVRYHVVPPKSRADVYQEFAKRIEDEGKLAEKEKGAKIEHILTLWKGREEWWNTAFKVPTADAVAFAKRKREGDQVASGPADATPGTTGVPSARVDESQRIADMRRPDASAPIMEVPVAATPPSTAPESSAFISSGGGQSFGGGGFGGGGTVVNQGTSNFMASGNASLEAAIAIKPWSPDTPYLKAMAAKPEGAYATYLAQRKDYVASPSFYLDCANWLIEHDQRALGIRVLSNIAQLRLESAPMLRIAAYRLMQIGEHAAAIDLFEKAKLLRPDEPQSWRDLAQALAEEALNRAWPQSRPNMPEYERQMADLLRAMDLYNHVVMNEWERFDEIELVSLMEANALWAKIQRLPGYEMISKQHPIANPLDGRLVKNLDCDVRIVMTWDADATDIDLHVAEPTGEEAYYDYNRTLAGGLVSKDFTDGYGPEEYLIHHAVPGKYKVMANFYGSHQQSIQGPVTIQAMVITNFGRADEKRQSMTLRVTEEKETEPIGEVTINGMK
ncbi:MAG TPA: DUF2135 domain-containing protein, partial [Phycisphaerae bacterium]